MRSRITEYAKYESLSTAFLTVERGTRDWCSLPSPLSPRHSPSVCPAVTGPNIGTLAVSHSCFAPEITWFSAGRFCTGRNKTMAVYARSFPYPTAAADSRPCRVLGKWQGPHSRCVEQAACECLPASGQSVPQVPHICKLFCVGLVHSEYAGVVVQPIQATLDMPFCTCKVLPILNNSDHNDVGHNSSCNKIIFTGTHFINH